MRKSDNYHSCALSSPLLLSVALRRLCWRRTLQNVQEPEYLGIVTILDSSGGLQPLERQKAKAPL